jgi:DNA-binding transcriptional MerR regulator
MYKNSEKTYSIGDAEKMTGISQRMLRAWEGKHIPFPERIVCGDRA